MLLHYCRLMLSCDQNVSEIILYGILVFLKDLSLYVDLYVDLVNMCGMCAFIRLVVSTD